MIWVSWLGGRTLRSDEQCLDSNPRHTNDVKNGTYCFLWGAAYEIQSKARSEGIIIIKKQTP